MIANETCICNTPHCSTGGKHERVWEEGDKRGIEDEIKMRGGDLVGMSTVKVLFVIVAVNLRCLRSVEFKSIKQESEEISHPGVGKIPISISVVAAADGLIEAD